MPEGPELEGARRLVDRTAVGKIIVECIAADDESECRTGGGALPAIVIGSVEALIGAIGWRRPPTTPTPPLPPHQCPLAPAAPPPPAWLAEVINDVTPRQLEAALVGRRIVIAKRRGKQLWMDLDTGPSLLLHFGMTGEQAAPAVLNTPHHPARHRILFATAACTAAHSTPVVPTPPPSPPLCVCV